MCEVQSAFFVPWVGLVLVFASRINGRIMVLAQSELSDWPRFSAPFSLASIARQKLASVAARSSFGSLSRMLVAVLRAPWRISSVACSITEGRGGTAPHSLGCGGGALDDRSKKPSHCDGGTMP